MAVKGKRNSLSLRRIISPYVFGEPGFDPTAFIVISSAAFNGKIIARFETIDQKITDIIPAFGEGFDQFLKFGHERVPRLSCGILKKLFLFYHTSKIVPMPEYAVEVEYKMKFAPFFK